MSMKFISIVGSVEEGRTYEPPIRNAAEAKKAAELLGIELARRGYGIIVYAGDFIEGDVVRGYVQAGKVANSIRVLYSSEQKGAEAFAEFAEHMALFDGRVDESPDWEMSFYGSLAQADGVVLIGGARSTLITGALALRYRIPLLALKAYGGSAEKVWRMIKGGRGLATEQEANDMAKRGDEQMVAKWVDSLESQLATRGKTLRRKSDATWAFIAGALVVAWVLALPLGYCLLPAGEQREEARPVAFLLLLFAAPLLAGASGATIRALIPEAGTPTARTTVLGMAAGAIAGVLYIISQLVANPKPYNLTILGITVAFGFIAGLTFQAVFKKLESVDVVSTGGLPKT